MALHLHRASRTDTLAEALGELLSIPLADPFARELVIVPARGVERWLSQRLSHTLGATAGDDGVCAGIDFRSPGSLVAEINGTSDDDPWSADRLTWPLLEVIDASLREPWAATLAAHLGATTGPDETELELRRGRRFAVARRLARLFATYAVQRPSVLSDWHAGRDTDGCDRALAADLVWQPELWRRLAERVGGVPPHERHREVLAQLHTDAGSVDLPARVSLFGHTRLSGTEVELLGGLAEHREIHLWLPHPSAALWETLDAVAAGPVPRAEDDSHRLVGHPLLTSLGRDVRELQRTLAVVPMRDEPVGVVSGPVVPDTLLGWLQGDLRANAQGAGRVLTPVDRSVQVHSCHGPARQVDVLREVVLGLLASDPTLEPRDVLVMCPDVETYAPLVSAGFGLGDLGSRSHPAHRLRVLLADRSLTQTNPLLAVLARLLELAGGRAGASDVLDLATAEPVRRRFGFSDDDLEQITEWVRQAGVRWAFDAAHRSDVGLQDYVSNTWEFGLDRVLAGVAVSDDAETWLDRTLPLDDVGSGQIELAGRLAEYVARLRCTTDRLVGVQPLDTWLDALAEGVAWLTAVGGSDAWQTGQLQRELAQVRRAAEGLSGEGARLRLPDVRALFSDAVAGRPTRANFRTGTLTVCTMVPMRSVPHRVVCLLGLDDGVFPRGGAVDGDDVLARDPMTGERDPRSEDRQLLLDALLAATETVVITYTGADEFSGRPRPPAVPLGELLDALDATATTGSGVSVSDAVTVHHPLQPFDVRNLEPGRLVPEVPFSFDRAALAGARAAAGARTPDGPLIPAPLVAAPAEDTVLLADLLAFFKSPVRGFLRERLDIALLREEEPVENSLPVEVDNLVQWAVADRVLRDLLRDVDPAVARQREWRRGVLPPGQLGWRILTRLVADAEPLAVEGRRLRAREARAVDVDVDLGGGRRLRGTVPEVYGDRLVPVGFSRLAATHRLQSWLQVLALAASDQDRSWTATTIGRPTNSRSAATFSASLLGPLDHTARDLLRDLVAMRDRGLCEPLPLPLKTSLAYTRARRTNATVDEALDKAQFSWLSGKFPSEDADAAHVRVWGQHAPIPGRDVPPGADEGFPGETSRFGALAMRPLGPPRQRRAGELVTVWDPVSEPPVFDPCGPLPTGTTLIEASAGTGKTWTVGALVTRFVAEGRALLDAMLVITFSRAASQELRERVRAQLVAAERALADPVAADRSDPLVDLLLDAPDEEVAVRRARLRDALATYDAATIATTHQFCQLVLRSLGVAGDTDAGATLVESLDDLVVEVVDDLYLRRFGQQTTSLPFDRGAALDLARTVVGDRQAELAPTAPGEDGTTRAGARVAFACEVREELDRRKRKLGLLSYDDLLSRLATALEADDAPARTRMRARWSVVLVDEFQDTDPVQWQVLDRAFTGHATMVLIGDPKQAIYAFRGGDVVTYLAAARTATTAVTLGTNWRADSELLDRLQVVLRGAALGDPEIVVRDVEAHHQGRRLQGAPEPASFRLRQVRRPGFRLKGKDIPVADARAHIAADCAGDIAQLLASDATWGDRPLQAADVAVLVGIRDHGLLVQAELAARGVPAVLAGGGHVFTTAAGDAWITLLQALDQPHRTGLVRSVALTPFVGESATGLDAGGDALTDRVSDMLRGWALLLRARGVAALFEAAEERGLSARVLGGVDGERLLTDLRHLAQLLHERATRDRLGVTGLLRWVHEERRRSTSGERPRRLDSDAAAVQILTIHGSKGLEYPVVHLPFAFSSFEFDVKVARYHQDGRRTLDVRGEGKGWSDHLAAHRAEEGGEELRDLYVALTRAQSQVVAWWAPTRNTPIGGLHRLLFGRQPGTSEVPDTVPVRDDDYTTHVLSLLEQLGSLSPEVSSPAGPIPELPRPVSGELAVRRFRREVDADWRRTSYSGLIRVEEGVAVLATGVTSEPEISALTDEPDVEELEDDLVDRPVPAPAAGGDHVPSPMADLPAGAAFGSLVHAVLEHTDPDAPATGDLEAELRLHCAEQLRWWPVAATAEELATALVPLHRTPLGPLAHNVTLGEVPLRDRLRELDFELPLSGGDSVRARGSDTRLRDLAPLVRELLPTDDPLAAYAARLEQAPLGDQLLRGYLTGSIDVVLRLPVTGGSGDKYLVVDYKTNLLGEPGVPTTTADYTPERLAEAMLHSHYPLQAMLYSATLHRYLRWRVPGYDPAVHLGGVLYLYLRGMAGAETPSDADGGPCGIFAWAPPAALVIGLSDLLDGSAVRA